MSNRASVKLTETVSSRGLKKSLPPSTAWSFTTMSAKQKRLALLKLEEEQALRMEMINRKYEILSCDDEDSPDEETTRGKTYSVRSVRNNPVISSEFQQKPYLERADPTSSDDERELCNHMNFDDSHRVCLDRVTKMYEEKRNLATQCNVNDVSHNRNETFTMQSLVRIKRCNNHQWIEKSSNNWRGSIPKTTINRTVSIEHSSSI